MPDKPSKKLRILLAVTILSTCIGCDQATKSIATATLSNSEPQSYLGDTVRLVYAQNPGGFLSLGGNLPDAYRVWMFIGLNSFFLLLLIGYLIKNWNVRLPMFVAVTLLLAGGFGNIIDRITQSGLVTDFLNLGIGPLRTGIFNVADVAVVCGVIAIVYYSQQTAVHVET